MFLSITQHEFTKSDFQQVFRITAHHCNTNWTIEGNKLNQKLYFSCAYGDNWSKSQHWKAVYFNLSINPNPSPWFEQLKRWPTYLS